MPCQVRATLSGRVTHLDCAACRVKARLDGEEMEFTQYVDRLNAFLAAHRPAAR